MLSILEPKELSNIVLPDENGFIENRKPKCKDIDSLIALYSAPEYDEYFEKLYDICEYVIDLLETALTYWKQLKPYEDRVEKTSFLLN